MKRIIGYTDQITECECCGKTNLKGTYCLEIDGVELYYGSTCAFLSHGITKEQQSTAQKSFKDKKRRDTKFMDMMRDHDESPTTLKLWKMYRYINNPNMMDKLKIFVEKYGQESPTPEHFEDKNFYIPYAGINNIWIPRKQFNQ